MLWNVAGLTVSCESVMPFIDEMPMCVYATAADQPNVVISLFFKASVVFCVSAATFELPKSNGIWVYTSMFAPSALDWSISRVPHQVGPVVDVPKVMIVLIPGLFCLTSFRAPRIRSCTTSLSNSSVFSMSMSIALSLYALITCWYAPASAAEEEQLGPSLLPLQPPKEMTMSPPAPRIALMFCWSTPPVSGRWLSHIGVQPPPESMNASVNDLTPVAFITVVGAGGLPQPKYRYGAAAVTPPPVGHPVVEPVVEPRGDSPTLLYAATAYVCEVQLARPETVAVRPVPVETTVEPSYTR